jgi:hypothetical protein
MRADNIDDPMRRKRRYAVVCPGIAMSAKHSEIVISRSLPEDNQIADDVPALIVYPFLPALDAFPPFCRGGQERRSHHG